MPRQEPTRLNESAALRTVTSLLSRLIGFYDPVAVAGWWEYVGSFGDDNFADEDADNSSGAAWDQERTTGARVGCVQPSADTGAAHRDIRTRYPDAIRRQSGVEFRCPKACSAGAPATKPSMPFVRAATIEPARRPLPPSPLKTRSLVTRGGECPRGGIRWAGSGNKERNSTRTSTPPTERRTSCAR
jgi:hypothetical protein